MRVSSLHLCSGPRIEGDLCDCVEKLGALHEINIIAIRIDPLAALKPGGDLGSKDRVWRFAGSTAWPLSSRPHSKRKSHWWFRITALSA